MSKYGEFNDSADEKITSLVKGKTITKFEDTVIQGKDFIVIHLENNSILRIRYDWLYEWEFLEGEK